MILMNDALLPAGAIFHELSAFDGDCRRSCRERRPQTNMRRNGSRNRSGTSAGSVAEPAGGSAAPLGRDSSGSNSSRNRAQSLDSSRWTGALHRPFVQCNCVLVFSCPCCCSLGALVVAVAPVAGARC